MGLKETINAMNSDLAELCRNLQKAIGGNKAAAQRVRTGTIRFARLAKIYRKESVDAEKKAIKTGKKVLKTMRRATAKLPKKGR